MLTIEEMVKSKEVPMIDFEQWEGFEGRIWKEEVNVRDFIQKNYTPYDGDESFLAGPTEATNQLWGALQKLQQEERAKGGSENIFFSISSTCGLSFSSIALMLSIT